MKQESQHLHKSQQNQAIYQPWNLLFAHFDRLTFLCEGNAGRISQWLKEEDMRWFFLCLTIVFIGCGVYGSVIGLWRGPLQALYVFLKFPLLIILVTLCNSLLNYIIAQLVGLYFSFKQMFLIFFMSFTIAALILGALSPVALFVIWNTPPLSTTDNFAGHSFITLLNVSFIGLAGMISLSRLYAILQLKSNSRSQTLKVFTAWVVGNVFVGCQLSWNLRPFIGSPDLPIQFLRPDALQGNFYIDVFEKILILCS